MNRSIAGVTLPEPAAHPQAGQPSSLSPGPPRCIAPSPRHLLTSPAAQGSPAAGNTVLHSSTSWGETLFFLNKNGLPVTGKGREEEKIAGGQPVSMLSAPSSPAPWPFVAPPWRVTVTDVTQCPASLHPEGSSPPRSVAGLGGCLTAECAVTCVSGPRPRGREKPEWRAGGRGPYRVSPMFGHTFLLILPSPELAVSDS